MRLGERIYYCKKKDGVEEYEAPIPITLRFNDFTLMATRGFSDIEIYGTEITNYYTAYAKLSKWGNNLFREGDKFYVDYAKPSVDEENYGDKANARIDSIIYDNLFIKIMIKKLVA